MISRVMFILFLVLTICSAIPAWADDDAMIDLDNHIAAFSGTWGYSTGRILYYGDDYRWALCSGSASITAEAAFSTSNVGSNGTAILADITGEYAVYVRWTTYPNRTINAKYRIYDGTTYRGTCVTTMNQQVRGGEWLYCSTVNLTASNYAVVKIGNDCEAGKNVIADAVRFVRVSKDTDDIINGSITTPKIAAGAVTTPTIGDGQVTTAKIGDAQVTTAKIAAGAVSTPTIGDGQITTAKIAPNGVTTSNIAANAITPDKIGFYSNVAIVAPSGGDYTNPVTAMTNIASWCGTPLATNPCLLKIMPGVYNIDTSSLQMQQYVDIDGSGENITTITGNVGNNTSGVVNGADDAVLRNLKVVNTGGGSYAIAIYNDNASPIIKNVIAKASDGGTYSRAIYNSSSSPTITDVEAIASGGFSSEAIVNNSSSSPIMNSVTATSLGGGTNSRAVYNTLSSPTMFNVTATATGATNNYGVYNISSGSTRIEHSIISGSITIWNGSGVVTYVANTRLDGGSVSNTGTLTCAGVYDENYAFYANTCP